MSSKEHFINTFEQDYINHDNFNNTSGVDKGLKLICCLGDVETFKWQ